MIDKQHLEMEKLIAEKVSSVAQSDSLRLQSDQVSKTTSRLITKMQNQRIQRLGHSPAKVGIEKQHQPFQVLQQGLSETRDKQRTSYAHTLVKAETMDGKLKELSIAMANLAQEKLDMRLEIEKIKAAKREATKGAQGLIDIQQDYIKTLRTVKEDQERLGFGIDRQIRDNFEYQEDVLSRRTQ